MKVPSVKVDCKQRTGEIQSRCSEYFLISFYLFGGSGHRILFENEEPVAKLKANAEDCDFLITVDQRLLRGARETRISFGNSYELDFIITDYTRLPKNFMNIRKLNIYLKCKMGHEHCYIMGFLFENLPLVHKVEQVPAKDANVPAVCLRHELRALCPPGETEMLTVTYEIDNASKWQWNEGCSANKQSVTKEVQVTGFNSTMKFTHTLKLTDNGGDDAPVKLNITAYLNANPGVQSKKDFELAVQQRPTQTK